MNLERIEIPVPAPSEDAARLLFGSNDDTRRLIERELPIALNLRGDDVVVAASSQMDATRGAELVAELLEVAQGSLHGGRSFAAADVRYLLRRTKEGETLQGARKMLTETLVVTERGPMVPVPALAVVVHCGAPAPSR